MVRNVGVSVGAFLSRRPTVDPLPALSPLLRTHVAFLPIPSFTGAVLVLPHRTFTSSPARAFRYPPTPTAPTSQFLGASISPRAVRIHESVTTAAGLAWKRGAHKKSSVDVLKQKAEWDRRCKEYKSTVKKDSPPADRNGASVPKAELSPQPQAPPKPTDPKATPEKATPAAPATPNTDPESATGGKPLLDRLPYALPHLYRPTKAELLEAASGFWSRMKVHFKWATIRSTRPFNADEIYAMFSWVLAAHIIWVIVGTTTFFSLTILLINTVFAQETLAKWIGNYLTKSSGVKVVFESAVVPKWKDGVISFRRVFVSRRPGTHAKVSKGSQITAAAAAAAIVQNEKEVAGGVEEEEDTNYTQFDISIDTVNVTLSFSKWLNGKGLLKDVEVKGIRGVVDRTFLHAPEEYIDPQTYKHEHQPGDFELDSFKMEDLLVTIYQPNNFRPFSVSIYSCDLPQLRKQWLFYDFLSANMMSGSFDNSLFTIHPRQSHNYTGSNLNTGPDSEDGQRWKKHSRCRIDGLNIDHLNSGYEGPFSWIHEGNVDIIMDVMIPDDNDDGIAKVMSDMYDRMEATVSSTHKHFSDHATHGFEERQVEAKQEEEEGEDKRFIIMDLRVHLNDVRAAVPIFTKDISYVNNALVRPIVAYINAKNTFIPVNCRVVKRAGEFNGSWTIYDSGLMDDLSREMYDAFARDVLDDRGARKRRIKKVGIWTLQLAAQALFLGLAGNIA